MKKLFKTLLVIAVSMSLNATYAQCTKKTDEMTKETSIDTKITKIGGSGAKGFKTPMYIEANMSFRGGFTFLVLLPQFGDIKTIEKGSTVYIKFEDESILKLEVEKTSISEHTSGSAFTQGSNTTIWYNNLIFGLTADQIKDLKAKKIAKIRVENDDFLVKGKQQEVIPAWIDCIEKSK